jgi:hypothetical protein
MQYDKNMRTTLELDDGLLSEARQLAKKRGATLGRVISDLAWQSLPAGARPTVRNGFRPLVSKPGAPKVDMEFVNRLRDEE